MDKIKRIQRTLKYSNICLYSGSTNISVMPLNLKSQFAYTICGRTMNMRSLQAMYCTPFP